MASNVKLIEGNVGEIRHVKAYSAEGQIGILKYEVDGDRGLIGKISAYREGVGRHLVSRMFDLHPHVTHWGISAISGRRASLFWYAIATMFNVTIHSERYGPISRANSREDWLQWPDDAWQYWLLPASLNHVHPDPDHEKDFFAGDEHFPFDGELYGTLLSRSYRSLGGLVTLEEISEAPTKFLRIPHRNDIALANTIAMVQASMTSPPQLEPNSGFRRGDVYDGVHRLSACRDHGSDAVVTSEATYTVAQFLRDRDPASVYWSTPAEATNRFENLIAWWENDAPNALRSLNGPHMVRLHDARHQMKVRYGV